MSFSVIPSILILVATLHAQVHGRSLNMDPFSPSFNPLANVFQGGVFSPGWGAKLAKEIKESLKNARDYSGISIVNGTTTVTQNINGRKYTAQLPPDSSVSIQSITTQNEKGVLEKLTISVNGDVTVYTTKDGRTTVTDSSGKVRADGGPFKIISTEGSGGEQEHSAAKS